MGDKKLPIDEAVQLMSNTLSEHANQIHTLQQNLDSLETNITHRISTSHQQTQQDLHSIESRLTEDVRSLHRGLTEIKQLIQHRPNVSPPPPPTQSGSSPTTTMPHTIVLPPASSFPTFSGTPSERPRQFLLRVEEYTRTVNKWSSDTLLKGISQFLRDSALDWYCQLHHTLNTPTTWPQFVTRFLAQFDSPIRVAQHEHEWNECKQLENETINEFVVRLRSLWLERKPHETETDLVKHLYCKMRPDMLALRNAARTLLLDKIIFEAQQVEEILYLRNKALRACSPTRSKPLTNESTIVPLMSVFPRTVNPPRNLQTPSSVPSNVTCWRCHETDHVATHCPLNDTRNLLEFGETMCPSMPSTSTA